METVEGYPPSTATAWPSDARFYGHTEMTGVLIYQTSTVTDEGEISMLEDVRQALGGVIAHGAG
ncbi:MAG: hypothetical protein JWQ95_3647 [Sphaerisporangium sp.]|jgi:hypothetical protein|nr:hypothetical protein [Sphaerisporangium sp.]